MPSSASCTASRWRRAVVRRSLRRSATSSNSTGQAACGPTAIRTTRISTSAAPDRCPASPTAPSTRRSPMYGQRSQKRRRPKQPGCRVASPARTASTAALEAAHCAVEAVEGQRKHAVLGDAADHPDAGRAGPVFLRHRIEPHCPRIDLEQAAQPDLARLVVPTLNAAALLFDLIGAHARVADENDSVAP